jgi:hypothetical protein
MKRNWLLVLIAGVIAVSGIALSCKDLPEDEPWASFASEVALKINVSENKVFEAFKQAFEDGTDAPGDMLDTRLRTLTEEDVAQIITWYENRPEGVTISGLYAIRYFGVEMDILISGSDKITDGLASEIASILGLEQKEIVLLQKAT